MPENERNDLSRIFRHLRDLDALRNQIPQQIKSHPAHLWWRDFPEHSALVRPVADQDDPTGAAEEFLRVRALATACPAPPAKIIEWLKPGWEDPESIPESLPEREFVHSNGEVNRAQFFEDQERNQLLEAWKLEHASWAAAELNAKKIHKTLTHWLTDMDRESGGLELVLGTGIAEVPAENVHHPVLVRKVTLDLDADDGALVFRYSSDPPELYAPVVHALKDADVPKLTAIAKDLQSLDLDLTLPAVTEGILGQIGSALPCPLAAEPVILLCKRSQGYHRASTRILEDLETGGPIPAALLRVVGLETDAQDAQSASNAEEPEAFLLGKSANEEQLRIASRLSRSQAVLVQGPPGTGKTHTIANLIGNFLAEGKSVLVTAQTSKALRVLRSMVAEPLHPLCLSVLDNDTENREQLNTAVQDIRQRLLSLEEEVLAKEAASAETKRRQLLSESARLRQVLLEACQEEMQPVASWEKTFNPVEAARAVQGGGSVHDWLPGPVVPGVPPPLSQQEAAELYRCNSVLTLEDERDLSSPLPDPHSLVSAAEFTLMMIDQARFADSAAKDMPDLWQPVDPPLTPAKLDSLSSVVRAAGNGIREADGWLLDVIHAGREEGPLRQMWEDLLREVADLAKLADEARPWLLLHEPEIESAEDSTPNDDVALLSEIFAHLKDGGSLGTWPRMTHGTWRRLVRRCSVSAGKPKSLPEFIALHALAKVEVARDDLRKHWHLLVTSVGGPETAVLGDEPERTALPIAERIRARLNWHQIQWSPVLAELEKVGFQWDAFADGIRPEHGTVDDLRRIQVLLSGFDSLVRSHRDALRTHEVSGVIQQMADLLRPFAGNPLCQRLISALAEYDPNLYSDASRELSRVWSRQEVAAKRRALLDKVEQDAPAWAEALHARRSPHDGAELPGNLKAAWQWRQLHDELERRAETSLNETHIKKEEVEKELHLVTARLVECKAWAAMKRRVQLRQQAAMEGYATCLKKMTKGGKGRRDAALLAAAREHLQVARTAVPVWIMPLARVYEGFFPDEALPRFDVVIIDEASQSDITSLAALYLGNKAIIVGDEEQVTPTPFSDAERMQRLIESHLSGIPNRELYDLETSIYHLARAFFRDRILLREHFRSVPAIVQFSNELSYDGQIQPLRESGSSPLWPHLVAHRVRHGASTGRLNQEEAEETTALILACLEQPEYQLNESGQPTSFGVISMVGDEQAELIDTLLRSRLSPAEIERRRILCGNAAQFQGDERDVMFLSMVDSSTGSCLPLRGFGPKEIFRKRFNVAASRARNQLWVVHSLDPALDLHSDDLRRRLITHAASATSPENSGQDEGSPSPAFVREVRDYLAKRQYRATLRWPVGLQHLNLVVHDERKRLAIECDGDRLMEPDELLRDADTQATLQRLGWHFVRVRASLYYREPDRAMAPVLAELERLEIHPYGEQTAAQAQDSSQNLIERVLQRMPLFRQTWKIKTRQTGTASVKSVSDKAALAESASAVVEPTAANGSAAGERTVVEMGDWVEFVSLEKPNDTQYVNIVSSATDPKKSAVNLDEPLARALLGLGLQEIGVLKVSDQNTDLRIVRIHKARKPVRKIKEESVTNGVKSE